MFSDFDATVVEFMREYGFTAKYIDRGQPTYDPATGETIEVKKEIPVQAILLDLTLQSNGTTTKWGTQIEAGDKEIYLQPPAKSKTASAAFTVDPERDSIKVGTVEYKIVTMKEINPTGTNVILYNLYLRK